MFEIGLVGEEGRRYVGTRAEDGGPGFSMQADIERDDTSRPDRASLTIRGINDDSAGAIDQRGAVCRVWAGYDGQNWLVFDGDIDESSISDTLSAPGRVITFNAAEGRAALRWFRIDRVLAQAGETPLTALSRAAQLIGLRLGPIPSGVSNRPYIRPYIASAPAREVLREIAADLGAKNPLAQKGVLVLSLEDQPATTAAELPFLRAGTIDDPGSVIGSPVRIKGGVEVTALWRPGVLPRQRIRVQSRKVNGDFLVKAVTEALSSDADGPFELSVTSSKELPA